MPHRRSSRSPRMFVFALLAVMPLLGGCVYLRLLQLKLQLAHFEQNFELDQRDGLALTFRHPVLLDEDMQQFFHWIPDSRQRVGTAEKWHFAWVKEHVPGDGDRPPVDVSMDLVFVDHKLVKLSAPERFFAITMPKSLAVAALRSLGHAEVDRSKRTASSSISGDTLKDASTGRFLTDSGLQEALGAPVEETTTPAGRVWRYRFHPVSDRQRFGENAVVDITFTFGGGLHAVTLMKGTTMFGGFVFDTTHVGQNTSGTVNAAL